MRQGREQRRRFTIRTEAWTQRPVATTYVATGLLMQARALRIRVPKDICIAGFDNIDSARFVSLTTIDMGSEHNGLRRRANYWIFRAMPFLNTRAQAVSRAKAYYDEARFALEF
ncbi:substrate-binding domain-containing protein [Agrobacterium radiobacter]|uniref:substrate-binding domain-containing protein n=1 Tax=Agrobacterium radiobacter TaxID=362 RepID=UPI0034679B1E